MADHGTVCVCVCVYVCVSVCVCLHTQKKRGAKIRVRGEVVVWLLPVCFLPLPLSPSPTLRRNGAPAASQDFSSPLPARLRPSPALRRPPAPQSNLSEDYRRKKLSLFLSDILRVGGVRVRPRPCAAPCARCRRPPRRCAQPMAEPRRTGANRERNAGRALSLPPLSPRHCPQGFKHFRMMMRGREELLVTIANEITVRRPSAALSGRGCGRTGSVEPLSTSSLASTTPRSPRRRAPTTRQRCCRGTSACRLRLCTAAPAAARASPPHLLLTSSSRQPTALAPHTQGVADHVRPDAAPVRRLSGGSQRRRPAGAALKLVPSPPLLAGSAALATWTSASRPQAPASARSLPRYGAAARVPAGRLRARAPLAKASARPERRLPQSRRRRAVAQPRALSLRPRHRRPEKRRSSLPATRDTAAPTSGYVGAPCAMGPAPASPRPPAARSRPVSQRPAAPAGAVQPREAGAFLQRLAQGQGQPAAAAEHSLVGHARCARQRN